MATQVSPVSITDLVSELRKLPESAFTQTSTVLELLKHHPVAPETLEPYFFWDSQHYTRNLIEKTSLFELMAICWEIGQVSSVHNHKDQNCWMAVPVGRLLVENFRTLSQDLEHGSCNLEPSETVEMNSSQPCAVDPREPVHRVLNPRKFNHRAISLHVYSRPFDSCIVYSPEKGTCGEIKLQYTSQFGSLT